MTTQRKRKKVVGLGPRGRGTVRGGTRRVADASHLVIAVSANKGGCGKTALAGMIAGQAAMRGHRVCSVDADIAQGDLTVRLLRNKRAQPGMLYQTFQHGLVHRVLGAREDIAKAVDDVIQDADLIIIDGRPDRETAIKLAKLADLLLIPYHDHYGRENAYEYEERVRRAAIGVDVACVCTGYDDLYVQHTNDTVIPAHPAVANMTWWDDDAPDVWNALGMDEWLLHRAFGAANGA